MKAYRKDPDFKPVVIEIESEDELLYLFHCLALEKEDVKGLSKSNTRFPDDVSDLQMCQIITEIVHPA